MEGDGTGGGVGTGLRYTVDDNDNVDPSTKAGAAAEAVSGDRETALD